MTHPTVDIRGKRGWQEGKSFLSPYLPNGYETLSSHEDVAKKTVDAPLQFYDASNIDLLDWPKTDAGESARNYLVPLVKKGTKYYINNIDVTINILRIDDHILPLVINTGNYENSYVCSPYGYYVLAALESIFLIKNRGLKKSIEMIINGLGRILKYVNINRIIYINHWLLSTDLHSNDLSTKQITAITAFLKKIYPHHALAFRSLNARVNAPLKANLKECGFEFIASRQVFITDTSNKELFNTRIIKSDLRLWKDNEYEIVNADQLTEEDEKQILHLYYALSINQHSSLNPQLNQHFVKLMVKKRVLTIKALRKNGVIEGVVGYTIRNNVLTCPFFGYDKTQQENPRLYRLLSTLLLLEASQHTHTFHQSAGASFYKTIRRAANCVEYTGIYRHHLPSKQRCTWWLLRKLINSIGIPLMKRY